MHLPFFSRASKPLDFLAIGDIVTEPFIRLKDASTHCTIDTDRCEICMRFGDKIPYDYAVLATAVGNASNAAVAASRLGLSASLRAYVGDDRYGPECLEKLVEEGVDTSLMVTEKGKATNYHYVLWFGSERTILVKHEEFSYTVPKLTHSPKWLYLSSLAENSLDYHNAIAALLEEHPETKLAFQPGTFQMKLGADKIKKLYERSELFFCNKQEAERILGLTGAQEIRTLAEGLRALGPKIVIITDGREGAHAFDGDKLLYVPMYPDAREPFERTGAGDSFAATVTCALALGKPLEEALLWGPINSMSVVQEVGAQAGLLSRAKLEEYLKNAPENYRIEERAA
ncbi:MAG TPA: carbohydrate kinase family protein [Candidatus Paceibacterota bacterium]|nr:carbohydrate kinase family protein [Candidatus Paceibacterota bacterium]